MRDELIELLRESESVSWVADQIEHTLAQGITMTVKDIEYDSEFYRLEPSDLTKRERKKRETYETTRAYTEEEAIELIEEAFEAVFMTLPSVQAHIFKQLTKIDSELSAIEFVSPDEPGREDMPHTLSIDIVDFSDEEAYYRVQRFFDEVRK